MTYWNMLRKWSAGGSPADTMNRFGLKTATDGAKSETIVSLNRTSAFFEDAVAVGLLAQRQFRRELMREQVQGCDGVAFREIQKTAVSTLAEYLDGSRVVFSRQGSTSKQTQYFPPGFIRWWTPSSSSSSSSNNQLLFPPVADDEGRNSLDASPLPKIIEFEGYFPRVSNTKNKKGSKGLITPSSFNANNILLPSRVTSFDNPVADVILNEVFSASPPSPSPKSGRSSITSDDDDLVQFWIDTEHSKHQNFPLERDAENKKRNGETKKSVIVGNKKKKSNISFNKVANKFNNALQDRRLLDDSSRVRHIVHIIITPLDTGATFYKETEEALKKSLQTHVKLPPRHQVKSYTLCFVTPDDLSKKKAFENLVSQPIALTIPLIEQQMKESWTNDDLPPSRSEWWSYRATKNSDSLVSARQEFANDKRLGEKCQQVKIVEKGQLAHRHCVISSQTTIDDGEFAEWRTDRFRCDCAVGIGHLCESRGVAETELAFEGLSALYEGSTVPFKIPFACVLEALGILPPRINGSSYCEYNPRGFRFEVSFVALSRRTNSSSKKDNTDAKTRMNEDCITITNFQNCNVHFKVTKIEKKGAADSNENFDLTVSLCWLLDQIRVGHVLRFDSKKDPSSRSLDYEEDGAPMGSFWKDVCGRYDKLKQSDGHNAGGFGAVEKTSMTCSDMWNMSMGEFHSFILREEHEREAFKKHLKKVLARDAAKERDAVADFIEFVKCKMESCQFVLVAEERASDTK